MGSRLRLRGRCPGCYGAWTTAIVVASLTLATSATALAAFPGGNGRIALSAGFGCGFQSGAIGSMNPDGTDLRMLTDCEYFLWSPDWSPDGGSLLFSSGASSLGPRISLLAADGSERRELSRGWSPSFAPDGRRYAYVRGKYLRLASLEGADDRRLRRGVAPVWSPKGRQIAYADREGVWLMSARTGERLRRVVSCMRPVDWSPDGRWLLCLRYGSTVRSLTRSDLYAIRANGKGSAQRLTWTRGSESDAAFSPDGRQIVFTMLARVSAFTLQESVWTMNRYGTDKKRIWEKSPYVDDDENRVTESGVTLSWQPLTDK